MNMKFGRSVGCFDLPPQIWRAFWSILARFGVVGGADSQNIHHE